MGVGPSETGAALCALEYAYLPDLAVLPLPPLAQGQWRRRIYQDWDTGTDPIVDVEARRQLAGLLHALVHGEIFNDDYEVLAPVESRDPAIAAIDRLAWELYPDSGKYRLSGKREPDNETLDVVTTWIVFLTSDLPYVWELTDPMPRLTALLRLVRRDVPAPRLPRPTGLETWPFQSMAEFEREFMRLADEVGMPIEEGDVGAHAQAD